MGESLLNDLFEEFVDNVENDDFTGFAYADTWDYEDEYSHNDIEYAREKFIDKANSYFKEHNMKYSMKEFNENAYVCDEFGEIIED